VKILLADDEEDSRSSVADFLREAGHEVIEAKNGAEALSVYKAGIFEMVMSDLRMPRLSGIGLLKEIRRIDRSPAPDVVLFTGQGDMESAIEALHLGAYDFVLKPLNVNELAALTSRIDEHQSLLRENKVLRKNLRKIALQSAGLDEVGFFSPEMKHLVGQALRYHDDRSIPVLIQGETGTGKEIIARLIHFGEDGSEAPFVAINCAALTPSLFESELFGYEGGSFTGGRTQGQKGKMDLAAGGTLLLDEIGELPLDLQAKLLRVLESREFFRVGGLTKIHTDMRVIGATNQELEDKVKQGAFRRDLYFRMKVGLLEIPPLRKRPEDIAALAELFLERLSRQKRKKFSRLAPETRQLFLSHTWTGNVRELRNTIEWAVFMHDDVELKPIHLPIGTFNTVVSPEFVQRVMLPDGAFPLEKHVHEIVGLALKNNGGNKKKTAEYLQISRRTLYTYLEHMAQSGSDE
jgi:DNA-binding NtrC family response regulator